MKRTERLYALIEILKDGELHRAEDLAQRFDVSLRTMYRDMDMLAASGVPVEGERGRGYSARAAITLPPLNLSEEELDALLVSVAAAGQSGDETLRAAAVSLAEKIDAVLPEDHRAAPNPCVSRPIPLLTPPMRSSTSPICAARSGRNNGSPWRWSQAQTMI